MSFLNKFKNHQNAQQVESPRTDPAPKQEEQHTGTSVPVKEIPDDESAPTPVEYGEKEWFHTEGQLTVDVYETDDMLYIQAPIAGVRAQDIEVLVESDHISIRGTRSRSREHTGATYFFQECYWGSFSRRIILPKEIDAQKAEAFFENGVLTVQIPKQEVQPIKKLHIKKI